jgi:murein DD-endopeptidase MepM/ murein hydrolase activator NlpD
LSLALQPDVERDVRVVRSEADDFLAESIDRPLQLTSALVAGSIASNLSADAVAAGVPMPVLSDLIRIFSFDVDFQRDIQPGDGFEVLYDAKLEADGSLAKAGDVRFAAMTLSGKRFELYAFTPKSGISDFFDTKGQSVRKTLMRTPIDGARLSSRFGMRKHPILGYTRMHRGTDFAAPTGTPIYAAGDGTVTVAGRKGAYGNYVRIRHNSTYDTAYAHMKGFAKGIRSGARVRQGQIIGYVGTTGRSTGPHLHYEVLVNGKQINPSKIKLASGEQLKGEDLANFQDRRAEIDTLRGAGPNVTQTVKAD